MMASPQQTDTERGQSNSDTLTANKRTLNPAAAQTVAQTQDLDETARQMAQFAQSNFSRSINRNNAGIRKRERTKEVKRRLIWTSALHDRFENVVLRMGLKSAQPKNILKDMRVEGLTRENVASHLQKYRQKVMRDHNLGKPEELTDAHGFAMIRSDRSDSDAVSATLVSVATGHPATQPPVPVPGQTQMHVHAQEISETRTRVTLDPTSVSPTSNPTRQMAPDYNMEPARGLHSAHLASYLQSTKCLRMPVPTIRDPDRAHTMPARLLVPTG